MSLVKSPEGLALALKTAFTHSSNVIIDKFIAGRELRCSVVEVVDQSGTEFLLKYGFCKKLLLTINPYFNR